jgi:hypothetical protein
MITITPLTDTEDILVLRGKSHSSFITHGVPKLFRRSENGTPWTRVGCPNTVHSYSFMRGVATRNDNCANARDVIDFFNANRFAKLQVYDDQTLDEDEDNPPQAFTGYIVTETLDVLDLNNGVIQINLEIEEQ